MYSSWGIRSILLSHLRDRFSIVLAVRLLITTKDMMNGSDFVFVDGTVIR